MSELNISWSKAELKAYLLIYCANADFHESPIETDFIKKHTNDVNLDEIHEEYSEDSDFQRIQKIRLSIKGYGYSRQELDELFAEINELMSVDKQKDVLNENMLRELHHLLG